MIRLFQTLLLLFVSFFVQAADPPGFISGKLSGTDSGDPLPGASIIFKRNQGTATDPNGFYLIRTEPGHISLTFQFIGYKSITRSVHVTSGDTLWLNIFLEPDITEIDQVVVSASKVEQRISELTVSMSVIRPEVISDGHITNTQELINKSSGVEVLDGQASIRGGSGFSYGAGSRVLALIDGLPILSADAGNIKWNSLPLENLSQVEIIKGASSVLYGSSALNGVINFRTADAGREPVTKFFLETGIFDRPRNHDWIWWNTPRTFTSASFSHLQKLGNTDIAFGSYFQNNNGYRRLNDETFGRINLRLKHYHPKSEGLIYGIGVNGNLARKTDFVLWENAQTGALKQDASTATELKGTFLALDPFISFKKGERFQHDLKSRFQLSENKFPAPGENDSKATSFLAEYQLWYKVSDYLNVNSGIYGFGSKIQSNFYQDHESANFAGYLQAEVSPFDRMKFVAGARLEYNALDGISDELVPLLRAGLNYRAADYTFVRASFGQGYRYPSIAEKFASTTLGSVVIIPNPDLMPESGWNAEIGVKQGIMTSSMNGLIDLAVFYTQNRDMIEFSFGAFPEGTGFRADNIEASRTYGVELEVLLNNSFGRFNYSLNGGYVFMYPVEFNSFTGESLDKYLKFRRKNSAKMNFTGSYRKFEFGLGLYARSKILNIDDVFLNPETREQILPGFYDYWQDHNRGHFLADANFGYRLNRFLRLSFVIKNLTNAEYMGRPGDIQPHRNFSLRLSGSF
jgi:outer membrane receptor protein involved in Fe transport